MLEQVDVYSSVPIVPLLEIDDTDSIENDFVQILDIQGLDPVKGNFNFMGSASRPGSILIGSSIPPRNIVMILRPNPDWVDWTPEILRKFLYTYFTVESEVKLDFHSEELGIASISGIVESCDANPFAKDPEYVLSLICEDPHFTVGDPQVLTHSVNSPDIWNNPDTKLPITREGNVQIGFKLKISPFTDETDILVQMGNSLYSADPRSRFRINADTRGKIVEINSIPGERYLRLVDPDTGSVTNIIDSLDDGAEWPMLEIGDNVISVTTVEDVNPEGSNYSWEITYVEKYGAI